MPNPVFKRIAVAAHPKLPAAAAEGEVIAAYLRSQGLSIASGLLYDEALQRGLAAGEFDLLLALGGDGTMLRAGHLCAPYQVPVLGVNMGRFGFLMEFRHPQWRDYLPRLLKGEYWLEQRMMLRAELWHAQAQTHVWDVLNEVVVGRGQEVRPVHLSTYLDSRFLTTYVADALIAATPTGSTAYALAAGGPILPPELRNILLVPVAPHLSIDHAIVLAEGSTVSITVQSEHPAVASVDGQPSVALTNTDRMDVRAGEHNAAFVRFEDPGYFYRNLTPHMNQNPATGTTR
jgi:NAD+ kinase